MTPARLRVAVCAAAFLAVIRVAPRATADDETQLYVLAVGSSWYAKPLEKGQRGFQRIRGANKSARIIAERLVRGGARLGVLLTSAEQQFITLEDIDASLTQLTEALRTDKPPRPLVVFYWAGHGISEGIGWSHFSIPGTFVYRGEPSELPVDDLSQHTLSAALLADRLDEIGVPYLVLFDACYEGTEARFDSPVLTGGAIQSLAGATAVLRHVNEFHQSSPILFSTAPGTVTHTAEDPADPSAEPVAPLARRAMILLERERRAGRPVTLGSFVAGMTNPTLDPQTRAAVTHAVPGEAWQRTLVLPAESTGTPSIRLGSGARAAVCCGADGEASSNQAASTGPGGSVRATGRIEIVGGADEYVSGGHAIRLVAPPTPAELRMNGTGDITIEIGTEDGAWELSFATPGGQPFAAARYPRAARHPFQDAHQPALEITGQGRGCNEIRGEFTVTRVEVGPSGTLSQFAARFTQVCDDGPEALTGSVEVRTSE